MMARSDVEAMMQVGLTLVSAIAVLLSGLAAAVAVFSTFAYLGLVGLDVWPFALIGPIAFALALWTLGDAMECTRSPRVALFATVLVRLALLYILLVTLPTSGLLS